MCSILYIHPVEVGVYEAWQYLFTVICGDQLHDMLPNIIGQINCDQCAFICSIQLSQYDQCQDHH